MRPAWFVILGLFFVSPVSGQEWTRFRGPNGSGVGTGVDVPKEWTVKDLAWKTPIPGAGHSSPVLWGKKIFVTSSEKAGARMVFCVDADSGKILWTRTFPASKYRMHRRNSSATSTPTVDASRLYVCWATPDEYTVFALDHEGKQLWKKEIEGYRGNHGFGVSPIVFEDLLIVPNEQDKRGWLVALDKATGNVRWKIDRQSGNATYATPCVYQPEGKPARIIFTNWQHGITAVDPKTGKVTWEISCFEPDKKERSIASPIIVGDLILGTCGFTTAQKHFVAVRPDEGDKVREIWRMEKAVAYLPTPLARGDYIYSWTEKGIVSCLEAKTGKVVWQDRVDGEFSGSPVLLDDRIYCASNAGDVFVLAASPKFEFLGRHSLDEATQSSPAIGAGRLIFRTQRHLQAIGQPKTK